MQREGEITDLKLQQRGSLSFFLSKLLVSHITADVPATTSTQLDIETEARHRQAMKVAQEVSFFICTAQSHHIYQTVLGLQRLLAQKEEMLEKTRTQLKSAFAEQQKGPLQFM